MKSISTQLYEGFQTENGFPHHFGGSPFYVYLHTKHKKLFIIKYVL